MGSHGFPLYPFPYILLPRILHFMPNIQFCRNPPSSKHSCKCLEITIWLRILDYHICFISLSNCSNLWQTSGIKTLVLPIYITQSKTTPLTSCHYAWHGSCLNWRCSILSKETTFVQYAQFGQCQPCLFNELGPGYPRLPSLSCSYQPNSILFSRFEYVMGPVSQRMSTVGAPILP